MSTAQSILVVYGTASVLYGMTLGMPLSWVRMSSPAGPRHLMTSHLSALMQGAMHLGLAVAAGFVTLTPWLVTGAAASLACGSALFVAGSTANWLMNAGDHFVERPVGFYLLSTSAPFHLAGAAIMLVGVVRAALA